MPSLRGAPLFAPRDQHTHVDAAHPQEVRGRNQCLAPPDSERNPVHRTVSVMDSRNHRRATTSDHCVGEKAGPPAPVAPPGGDVPAASVLPHSELIATQQMSNVGLLAAGLAHDLNNLLTVILGSAELARDSLPAPAPARHHLHTIESTVRRAAEMCRAMLACARTDRNELEAVDANALVQETVKLLQTSRLAFHRVRLDLAPGLPHLHANPAQFRQIVLNLLTNAAEACGARGGRIRVSTTIIAVDARMARHLRPATVAAGRFARLRVADDGCGMEEETQQRLFTPFFSRKAQGRGLGLASLLEIARAHGGGVRVFSEVDRGSIFDVFLPLATSRHVAAARASDPAAPGFSSSAPRLSGNILIADDEEVLRDSLASFLRAQGLTVHTAANGEEALAHLTSYPETELVLIDLMMPRLSGLDALTALRASGRSTPVILMTGNADTEIIEHVAPLQPVIVLAKPFSLVELLQHITSALPARP